MSCGNHWINVQTYVKLVWDVLSLRRCPDILPFKTHLLPFWAKWPWAVSDGSNIIICTMGLLLDAFTKLWRATVNFIILMSVLPHEISWFPLDRFSWNLMFEDFSKTYGKKRSLIWNLTRIMGTLHENIQTFVIISRWILCRMRNVPDKGCRGNQNTTFMFNNFFFGEKHAI